MFDGFSFDAPATSSLAHSYTDVSPTTSPAPYLHTHASPTSPPVSMSVADLAQRFRDYTIRDHDAYHRAASAYPYLDLPVPSTEDRDSPAWDPASLSLSSPTDSTFSSTRSSPTPPTVRERRQAHTQMQCDSAHARDISTLVERMIAAGEQCVICSRRAGSSVDSSSSAGETVDVDDEGVDLDNDAPKGGSGIRNISAHHTLRYRRSGELLGAAASVSKNIRVRKRPRKVTSGALR